MMDILISLALSVIAAGLAWLCYCLIGGPR